ncbi:DDB1- and CUL4-associated factor 11, partial [Ophiophagus hannah]
MGSRSSSNAGSGGRENQGSWSRRDSGILRSEDEDEDVDLAQVLAYLLRRGQFHLMQGGGTASARVFQAVSDSDDDTDNAWEGRLGDQYKPPDNPFDYASRNSSAQGKAVLTPLFSCEVGGIEMSKTGFAANLKQP